MTSVWKRLQRVGKKASKFQFAASFQELMIECTNKWQPDKLRVVWIRRSRRHSTKLHSWQPGIQNPYRGLVIWQVPESLDVSVTLFKEPTAEEFEDKDWTFVIENETKGRRKVLASVDVNMKKYASATSAQYDITLKLKPMSVKVVEATLKLNLSCVFLKEGKATDEDMQSLASLMSMKQSDIGNLDDFVDSDDEAGEERRGSFGTGHAAHVSASALSTARIHDLAWRPAIQSGPTVMDCKTSSGISSTTSAPFHPPLPEPPHPSVPSSLLQTHTRPPSTNQQARPSPYAYSLPAFTRAHPPALPKIFQPGAGSGISPRRPHSFHSDSCPAEGSEAPFFSTCTSPEALSTSSVSATPSDQSLHPPFFSGASQTACPTIWRAQSVPSVSSVSSSSSAPPTSFPILLPPPPVPHPKSLPTSAGGLGSALTRPTSLPSAPETAPWQSEWRPPKCQAPLAQKDLSPKFLHLSANDPREPAVLPKKQRIEMPSSSSLPIDQSLEKKPQGGYGFVPSSRPQATPVVEPSLPPLRPSSALILSGPPPPPPPHTSQTVIVSPSDQDTEFKRQLSTLSEEDKQCTTPTTPDPRAPTSRMTETSRASDRKRDLHSGVEVLKTTPGPPNMVSLQPSCPVVAGAAEPQSQTPIINAEQMLEKHPTNRTILWEELPEVFPMFPGAAMMLNTEDELKTKTETGMTDLLPICPAVSGIFEFSATAEKMNECPLDSQSTRNKPPKNKGILTSDCAHLKEEAGFVKQTVDKTSSHPSAQCMPYYVKTEIENKLSSFMLTCPSRTNIVGMPSKLPVKEKHSLIEHKPIWEKQSKVKGIFPGCAFLEDGMNKKEMVLLVPSCPREARTLGFPSLSHYSFLFRGQSMVDMHPCCPHVSSIPGVLSISGANNRSWISQQKPLIDRKIKTGLVVMAVSTKVNHESDMMSLLSSCPKTSCVEGFPSLMKYQLNKSWAPDYQPVGETLPKINIATIEDRPHNEEMKAMSVGQTSTKETQVHGFPSDLPPTVICKGSSSINLLQSCPAISFIAGFPSIQKADSKDWNIIHHPLWEKPFKKESVLILKNNGIHKDMTGIVPLAQSCPSKSSIFGFPSVPKPRMSYGIDMTNMISLSCSMSKESQILGFPSSHNSKEWKISKEPLFEPRMKVKQVSLTDIYERDERAIKTMISLVPSCPKAARMPGFPSNPNPLSVYCATDIISLSKLCPQVSRIPGIPSVVGNMSLTWVTEKGSLLKRLPTKGVIFDTSNDNKKIMKNMISLVPSCPKAARMPGFPSHPNPLNVYCVPDIISLSTLCPQVSRIPGIPSVVGNMSLTWVTEKGSLLKRLPTKGVIFDTSNYNEKEMKNMISLVPSCPKAARIPGFPSHPNPLNVYCVPDIISLSTLCPQVSRIPGIPSVVGNMSLTWVTEKGSLLKRLPTKGVIFDTSNDNKKIMKNMVSLVPSCPKAARMPGFPSHPNPPSVYCVPDIISLSTLCPQVSRIPGIPSVVGNMSLTWVTEKGSLLKRLPTKGVIFDTSNDNKKIMKNMVSLVPSCPKAARMLGFPSHPNPQVCIAY
ncbi:uncharacterized protein ehbp1l1a isoform X9 [Hippoglossus stenolepis]|uniref:uncharacterized protein ehbp1l1a isoform X9 n=1 Tax=Hippoglossus stenolepis TaxID=195615 RepID=UPI001FAFE3E5|nr:uncharacterized protein ehbp1l1a isoform X9 [Hippoglossus stenolepis]